MSEKWMSVDEVIEHVMKVEKCSRRTARRKVAEAAKSNKLPFKKVPITMPAPKPMDPEEAARLFEEDPESIYTTLADLMVRHDFTGEELLEELRSGRLRANASEATAFKMQSGERCGPAEFAVDYKSLVNWLAHPQTPQHLIAKFYRERKMQ